MLFRRLAVLIAATSMVLSACGAPAAPALTDPKDILSKSIVALQGLKSAHLHVDLSGSVKSDISGSGTASPIDLSGTTADLDIDRRLLADRLIADRAQALAAQGHRAEERQKALFAELAIKDKALREAQRRTAQTLARLQASQADQASLEARLVLDV